MNNWRPNALCPPGLPRVIAFDLLSPAQHQRLRGLRLPPEWHAYLN